MRRTIAVATAIAALAAAAPASANHGRAHPGDPALPPGIAVRSHQANENQETVPATGSANRILHGCEQNAQGC